MRPDWPFVVMSLITFALPELVIADTTVINFDNFNDGDVVTTQIPGVTFTNTIVLTAGISLDDSDFPPHSGTNVASDNGGPISISFATTISELWAYFTYAEPVTLQAFDPSNALIATASSLFPNNTSTGGFPGSAPNELVQVAAPGIKSVTFTGDPGGDSFTVDDVTFTTSAIAAPEPHCILLMVLGLIECWLWSKTQMLMS